ncbi:type VII secretion integral membrane protein EccD [Rhodococcus sp. 27YEA15]|uniref:type VII secretion integral membrane protein EccD n=1 Tax=Rhodococcus sp. 27YEA15 TaxID=3156259 RepID=UPI003C7E04F5
MQAGNAQRLALSAELCRLTVLSAHSQVDLAVPLHIPLTLAIPGIVDTIVSHREINEFDDSAEQLEPVDWTLARVGRAPLAPALSLHEHGIRDGELLVLEAADSAAPAPLFDDVMYTVAAAGADDYRRWTPGTARITGSSVGIIASAIGSLALVLGSTELVGALCALTVAAVFAIIAVVLARVYHDGAGAITLGCMSMSPALASGILLVPGTIEAAHFMLGTALAAAVSLLCLRLCGTGLAVFTAAFGITLSATAVFGAITAFPRIPVATVCAVCIAVALLVITFSARLSMLSARLPLPPVPAPANPLGDDPNGPPEPEPASLAELTERASIARNYLTGLVVTSAVVAAAAAVAVAIPRPGTGIIWQNTLLAAVTAVVLMFRGRTFAGAHQAVPLIGAGIAIVLVVLGRVAWIHVANAVIVFGACMATALFALVVGILAPQRIFSPVMRRTAELIDLAAISAVVPLVCWVGGLFATMRGL